MKKPRELLSSPVSAKNYALAVHEKLKIFFKANQRTWNDTACSTIGEYKYPKKTIWTKAEFEAATPGTGKFGFFKQHFRYDSLPLKKIDETLLEYELLQVSDVKWRLYKLERLIEYINQWMESKLDDLAKGAGAKSTRQMGVKELLDQVATEEELLWNMLQTRDLESVPGLHGLPGRSNKRRYS